VESRQLHARQSFATTAKSWPKRGTRRNHRPIARHASASRADFPDPSELISPYTFCSRAPTACPFSNDFFRNLSDTKVTQVLGVTLPPFPSSATGVYAEQETKRLSGAFNSMFYSLANAARDCCIASAVRKDFPASTNFPRELQKRIAIATQFLVDLCRPSHLRTSAFLRDFIYGIRQVEAANPLGGTMLASKTSINASAAVFSECTSHHARPMILARRSRRVGRRQRWADPAENPRRQRSGCF